MSEFGVLAGKDVLDNRTALLLRSVARAVPTVRVLDARGARTVICQLIDFELPANTTELDAGLRRLLAGEYNWCVLTSVNTLVALRSRATALGLELRFPIQTRVAVVGEATARAVQALGAHVDFMPAGDHSARGMLADWDALRTGSASVFAPQADIASSTLRDGFVAHGWAADIVIAYNTVTAPAAETRALYPSAGRPEASGSSTKLPESTRLLNVTELESALPDIDAIMFSSPSTVDTFLNVLPGAPGLLREGQELIAIGDSTAARMRECSLPPTGIAALPTAAAMADAWAAAVQKSRDHAPADAGLTAAAPTDSTHPNPAR